MNRVNDSLYLMKKTESHSFKSFSFNYLTGYLFGMHNKSCMQLNTESDYFIYYDYNRWMLTDLTKYLNPDIYFSKDYHGIWKCLCSDKKLSSRFTSQLERIYSNDEIKISETVMSLEILGIN
jgi:hypothetical protein